MKKRLGYLLMIFALFIFIGNVNAKHELVCKYQYTGTRITFEYKLVFSVSGDNSTLKELIKTEIDYIGGKENVETDLTYAYKNTIFKLTEEDACPSSISFVGNTNVIKKGGGEAKLIDSSKTEQGYSMCVDYKEKKNCKSSNAGISCVWNEKEINGVTYEYCNVDALTFVACGDTRDIPSEVPALISFAVNFLKIIAPLILIFVGIISLVKAIMSSNEDEMKKAQKSLTRKIIPSVLIFFVISIVQFVIGLVADDEIGSTYNDKTEAQNLSDCLDCFLNNNCEDNIYYKTNIGGIYHYYSITTGEELDFDNKFYLTTNYYEGKINTDCESYGYFDFQNGAKQIYHPKAVDVNGVCYELEPLVDKTGNEKKLINYTETLDGTPKNVPQTIYKVKNGNCYYWEGRINDYIQISCDTEIVTKYYRGEANGYCDDGTDLNKYFEHEEGGEGNHIDGFRPRKIYDPVDNKCYYLEETGFHYTNRTQTLFGEYLTISQDVLRAGDSCFYWSDVDNEHKLIDCKDHD